MTLIIGIVCKESIVVCSDSRTSNIDTGRIDDDAKKISVVALKDATALVAQAGNCDLSAEAVEIIERNAANLTLTDYRSFAEVCQTSVSELKDRIRIQYRGTAEELQRHFEKYGFELMIAHYFNDQPYIFTLDFCLGQAVWKRNRRLVSVGCCSLLADFLIKPLISEEQEMMQSIVTAIYAIEEVKQADSRCGGPVQLAVALAKPAPFGEKVNLYPQEFIDLITSEVKELNTASRARWKKLQSLCVIKATFNAIKKMSAEDFKIFGIELKKLFIEQEKHDAK